MMLHHNAAVRPSMTRSRNGRPLSLRTPSRKLTVVSSAAHKSVSRDQGFNIFQHMADPAFAVSHLHPRRCLLWFVVQGGDGMLGKVAMSAAVFALVSSLTASASYADLDTETYKAGPGAKIEYSDITDESPTDVVKKLKDEVVPKAQEKLNEAAERSGSQYPSSIAKELKTVKGEVDALDSKVESGEQEGSVVKSAASAVEQQVNALKALLGFD